jgi:cytochrome c oxidase subunit 3
MSFFFFFNCFKIHYIYVILKRLYLFIIFDIWYGFLKRRNFGNIFYKSPIHPEVFFAFVDDDERERFATIMRPYYLINLGSKSCNSLEKKTMHCKRHNFHLVDESPWPFFISFSVLSLALGFIGSLNKYSNSLSLLIFGFLITISIFILWCKDIISEGTFQGKHTSKVQRNLRIGFTLFIVSEIMLFLSFFWAFFHFSLAPAIEIGGVWPPMDSSLIYPYGIPLLNTIILVISGGSLTWVHIIIVNRKSYYILDLILNIINIIKTQLTIFLKKIFKSDFFFPFLATLGLAILFTGLQAMEYAEAPFSINDGVFGSVFYMTTGLHGLHVIIGTIFITVGFIRFFLKHFTARHHIGFETSAWYWHFVDVVWILLFLLYYVWSYRNHAVLLFDSVRENIRIHVKQFLMHKAITFVS